VVSGAGIGLAYHRSVLGRFDQTSAGISKADGMAALNDHPSPLDGEHDCVSSHRVQLLQTASFLGLAICRVVQGAD
jgi:hypothetical protein